MLGFCDAGDEFGPPLSWAVAASGYIPSLLRVYLNDRLGDCQTDQAREASRLDWRQRNDED